MLTRLLTPCIVALVLIGLVATLQAANPTWAASAGIDVWNLPTLEAELDAAHQDERTLGEAEEEMSARIQLKERLIADLIDGRTTLAEVTAQFLALNQDRPACMTTIRAVCPGQTDGEKVARNVLDYALPRVGGSQAHQAEVIARLTTEFHQLTSESVRQSH